MNSAKQAVWLLFTLIILATSGWFFAQKNKTGILDDETLSSTIDTTITQLTLSQFNKDGVLINKLSTPLIEHIPKDDIHLLQTPHIVIHQENQPAWEINAMKAKSFFGGSKVVFMEQVVVHQNPGGKTPESTLKTEEVTYFPKEKRATTELFVTFEQPGNIIESTGMNAYLDEKRVELLHGARGRYDPAKG